MRERVADLSKRKSSDTADFHVATLSQSRSNELDSTTSLSENKVHKEKSHQTSVGERKHLNKSRASVGKGWLGSPVAETFHKAG